MIHMYDISAIKLSARAVWQDWIIGIHMKCYIINLQGLWITLINILVLIYSALNFGPIPFQIGIACPPTGIKHWIFIHAALLVVISIDRARVCVYNHLCVTYNFTDTHAALKQLFFLLLSSFVYKSVIVCIDNDADKPHQQLFVM